MAECFPLLCYQTMAIRYSDDPASGDGKIFWEVRHSYRTDRVSASDDDRPDGSVLCI